jgi:hypothetical protein
MMKAFFDDSGSDDNSPFYVLSGYASTVETWEAFSSQWSVALAAAPSIGYFHMVDANGLCQEFQGWGPDDRDAKLTNLATVMKRNVLCEVSCTLPRGLHHSIIRGSAPSKRFENPYFVCYATVVSILSGFRDVIGVGSQVVDLVFDKQAKIKGLAADLHSEVRSIPGIGSVAGSIQFLDDKEATPLQAADFIAWGLRRFCAPREVKHGLKQVWNVPNVRIQPTGEMLQSLAHEFQECGG